MYFRAAVGNSCEFLIFPSISVDVDDISSACQSEKLLLSIVVAVVATTAAVFILPAISISPSSSSSS